MEEIKTDIFLDIATSGRIENDAKQTSNLVIELKVYW